MNEIHLGQPSDQYKNWCKKWYTQKFGRCIRTGNEYENNDICEVSTTNVDGIVKTVKINRYTAKNTVLESNATYLKLTNSYHTTYYIVIYDGQRYISYDLGKHSPGYVEFIPLSDIDITYIDAACLLEHTPITLADGSKKMIEDIMYDDQLLTYDFDTGKKSSQKPAFISAPRTVGNIYSEFTFKSGRILRVFDQHRVFSVQKNMFQYASRCIGDDVILEDGTYDTLLKHDIIEVDQANMPKFYNVITQHDFNMYANDILTSNRYSNMYAINDMKYVKDGVLKHTRADFGDGITDEEFTAYRYAEQPGDVESLTQHAIRLRRCKL